MQLPPAASIPSRNSTTVAAGISGAIDGGADARAVRSAGAEGSVTSPQWQTAATESVFRIFQQLCESGLVRWQLLDSLNETTLDSVRQVARRRRYATGDSVFRQGDAGDSLHIVETGRFEVRVLTPMGFEMVVQLMGAGDYFGELALLAPPAIRSATVTAFEASSTWAIHESDFSEIRRKDPSVDRLLVAALADRVRTETDRAIEAAFMPVERRVARQLMSLVSVFGGLAGNEVELPITQELLAGLVGTTRSTVNRVLRSYEEKHWVRLHRSRIVLYAPGVQAHFATTSNMSTSLPNKDSL
jgi:CRP/FNR family transcriptional regulator, cyclic AMP receptor protein